MPIAHKKADRRTVCAGPALNLVRRSVRIGM